MSDLMSRVIGDTILVILLVPLVLFIFLYGTRSPWRLTPLGRSLMLQKLLLVLLVGFSLFSTIVHDYPGYVWIRILIYLAVAAALWTDVYLLRQVQKRYPFTRPQRK